MEPLKISELLSATNGKLLYGDENDIVEAISTDSRKIPVGCLFIPLVGANFDGHDFIEQAFLSGAKVCLTEKQISIDKKPIIMVENTLKALQDIAKYYKEKFNIPFVAVTGSVGKTTTKDMIACVLSQKFNVLKTQGNLNNHIGLPLTLLNLNKTHNIGVVEMGMSGFGEIEVLSKIVMPDTAVITNIGVCHIEMLGSQENILKAKLEIVSGMNKDGHIVLNGDDSFLRNAEVPTDNIYYYGIKFPSEIYPYNIENLGEDGSMYCVKVNDREYTVKVPVAGEHNIYNSLSAMTVGLIYGLTMEEIIQGIASFEPGSMRQNIVTLYDNIKIIEDCYNASPQSMKAAISVLCSIKAGRKIAVLGDMLELGEYSKTGHIEVGKTAVEQGVDFIFAYGNYKEFIKDGALKNGIKAENVICFQDMNELSKYVKSFIRENDVLLVKGSRGMKMEQIVKYLREVSE